MDMPGMDGMPGMGGSTGASSAGAPSAGGSAAGGMDMAGMAKMAGGLAGMGLVNLNGVKIINLQNLADLNPAHDPERNGFTDFSLLNLQQAATSSQYVPFGPSAGQGMQVDLGDSITDTAIMGDMAYNTYAASQPAIDALWSLIDPKGHKKNADTVFKTVDAVGDIGNAFGGWSGMASMGQGIAGRPAAPSQPYANPTTPAQQQPAAEQWQQADESGLWWYWASTQQYYNSSYQLYFDPASQMYYDGQGNQWSIQETDEYYAQGTY